MTSDSALADVPDTTAPAHESTHKTDAHYVRIAVILAALTTIEVALSYTKGLNGLALVIPLMIVMAIKFALVALYFMHLKWDSRLLTRLFYGGLFLAVGVYIVALSTFRIFNNG